MYVLLEFVIVSSITTDLTLSTAVRDMGDGAFTPVKAEFYQDDRVGTKFSSGDLNLNCHLFKKKQADRTPMKQN